MCLSSIPRELDLIVVDNKLLSRWSDDKMKRVAKVGVGATGSKQLTLTRGW